MVKKKPELATIDDEIFEGSIPQEVSEQFVTDASEEHSSDVSPNAEDMNVSLKQSIHLGEPCVEVFAQGEGYLENENGAKKVQRTVLLARVTEKELAMFPLVSAAYRSTFLEPKYDELTTITVIAEEHSPWRLPETIREFDGLLDSLPVGFGRHAKYGLGFKWEYRLIPEAILEFVGITELVIEPDDGASVDLPKFRLGIERFTSIRRSIDAISRRAKALQHWGFITPFFEA